MSITLAYPQERQFLVEKIKQIRATEFEEMALAVYDFQKKYNALYKNYLSLLKTDNLKITHYTQIPPLPIAFFKTHLIQTGSWSPAAVYRSSATTGSKPSTVLVRDQQVYLENTQQIFQAQYGKL